MFALGYQHPFNRSSSRNSLEALQLAYTMVDVSPQETEIGQQANYDPRSIHARQWATHSTTHYTFDLRKDVPQIYFLTSGTADGGSRQVLDRMDELDDGRNISVHSIAFSESADLETKQFVKNLAHQTGGFFRSIEQPTESLVNPDVQRSAGDIPELHPRQHKVDSGAFEVIHIGPLVLLSSVFCFLGFSSEMS